MDKDDGDDDDDEEDDDEDIEVAVDVCCIVVIIFCNFGDVIIVSVVNDAEVVAAIFDIVSVFNIAVVDAGDVNLSSCFNIFVVKDTLLPGNVDVGNDDDDIVVNGNDVGIAIFPNAGKIGLFNAADRVVVLFTNKL